MIGRTVRQSTMGVMQQISALATNRPVSFVFMVTIAWFVLLVAFTGILSSAFHAPYGSATAITMARLAVTVCILLLVWRMGWLEASGVACLGSWQVWALAIAGMVYFTYSSLYSFYSRLSFDFLSLIRLHDSRTAVAMHFAAGLNEEMLFRGIALYALIRAWRNSRRGILGGVVLISLLFAVLHIMQIFTHDVSYAAVLLLTLQTFVISIWWGALVVSGGSIWPAVMLHFVINAVVAVQGLTAPVVEPATLAYIRHLLFSVPLGVLGIWMLVRKT